MTAIYLAQTDDLRCTGLARPETWLDANEQQRYARFTTDPARERFLASRIFLKSLLARHLDSTPADIRFTYSPSGKPSIDHASEAPTFSLSHSGDWLALAVGSSGALGIDIEHPKKDRDTLAIARHYFHRHEYLELKRLSKPEHTQTFYRYWTLKEAFFKARGTGIAEGLSRIRIQPGAGAIQAELDTDLNETNHNWRWLYRHNPMSETDNLYLAVAQRDNATPAFTLERVRARDKAGSIELHLAD